MKFCASIVSVLIKFDFRPQKWEEELLGDAKTKGAAPVSGYMFMKVNFFSTVLSNILLISQKQRAGDMEFWLLNPCD